MTNNHPLNYRWYILTLGALTHLLVFAIPLGCMPVLFKEIGDELGINLVQIGMIWGMGALAGVLTSLLGGLIGDRYGTKRTLSIACLLAAAAGALRGISGDFTSLAVTAFFFGLLSVTISLNVHKTASEWFSGRHLGVANGILATGIGVGMTLSSMISATVLSPALGGWRNVLFLYGAVSIIISLLWFLSRSAPVQPEAPSPTGTVPLGQALSRVVHIRSVWFLALTQMCYMGCIMGVTGYLPLYLRRIGWTAASADGALAAFSGASTVTAIPLTLLSDRLRSRKIILFPALLIAIISVGLLSVVDGAAVWPLVILVGLFRDAFVAILITTIMEIPGVGSAYAGTAVGLVWSFGCLGGFISPPLGNSLASIDPSLPFALWAALAVVSILVLRLVKEKG